MGNKGEIWIEKDFIESQNVKGMIFMIIPKINIINVTKDVFEVFKENNRTRITLHNKF